MNPGDTTRREPRAEYNSQRTNTARNDPTNRGGDEPTVWSPWASEAPIGGPAAARGALPGRPLGPVRARPTDGPRGDFLAAGASPVRRGVDSLVEGGLLAGRRAGETPARICAGRFLFLLLMSRLPPPRRPRGSDRHASRVLGAGPAERAAAQGPTQR